MLLIIVMISSLLKAVVFLTVYGGRDLPTRFALDFFVKINSVFLTNDDEGICIIFALS